MALRSDYTGKFRMGRKVNAQFYNAAISCQSFGLVRVQGIITGTERANGVLCYVLDSELLVSENEITGYV